ncbi:Na(+)-translocating NADH-quinone reductase subunit C [Bacteroidia bacterium]|nr:Na(+)-translocating NADH-quinone reductase subunit C [Bacteroidia bacterium]
MNRDSNTYTIIYASVMVVAVAILLAFTAQSLRGYQKANEDNDKRQQILRSIHVDVKANEAEAKFNELIEDAFLVDDNGNKVEGDAFEANATKTFAAHKYPVFVANIDGQKKYVMTLQGAGFWGPLWGYISLNNDFNTIYGADFSHEGETPGLGAEIATSNFRSRFDGKHIFQGDKFTSVAIVKVGKSVEGQDYVDGISGGTITSKAADVMISGCLSKYVGFLTSQKK